MGGILDRAIEQDMKESYLDYAMSVIVGRALPDVRDGLKPVHRRILFGMHELGNTHDKPYKKSARVVGEVLGKYHPHGDVAIYDSLVRMAQDFSMRYVLVDGQGNFGSIDGDSAAAMRYCVTGDSLIISDKGLEKIGALSEKEDIDRMVLSADNKANTASKWFDSGEHPTKKITTHRGFSLTGTPNHPILVWEKNARGRPRLKWKLIQDLKVGDYAVISRSPALFPGVEPELKKYHPRASGRTFKVHELPAKMSPDLAFLIGAIIAEGNVSKEQIGFCNSDGEFLAQFKTAFKNVFPDCRLHEYVRKPVGYTKKPYASLEIHSMQVIEFFRNMGLLPVRARLKDVPEAVMKTTKEGMSAFLRGYAEGDGSAYRSGAPEIAFISMSLELLKKLQIMLLRFGIESSYRYQPSKKIYKLLIRGVGNLNLFKSRINFATRKKVEKLAEICKLNCDLRIMSKSDFVPYIAAYIRNNGYTRKARNWLCRHNIDRMPKILTCRERLFGMLNEADKSLYENLIENNYLFDRIAAIEDAGVQKVYSIRVDSNCHSFVSNGFISHNTEVRMKKLAEEMLADIEKETVAFVPNFDGTLKEPTVLPSRVPTLLINGSSGIAVGMATNIPPHNLGEIIDALVAIIEGADESKILQIVPGPDFPTGGTIVGRSGIYEAYRTGRGIIRLRAKIETNEKDRMLVVREIPYQITKVAIIDAIADAVKEKRLEGISGIHDRSDKEGMEVVIELKKDAVPEVVLNQLYAHTPLESTFGINNLALVNNSPKTLPLYGMLRLFVEFRQDIVRKRCAFEKRQAEARAHILEGLMVALRNIDEVVALIKGSKDPKAAKAGLMHDYALSEKQAEAIVEMKLRALTGLEREKIENELAELKKLIAWLAEVLADEKRILAIIREELLEIRKKYADARKTGIIEAADERTAEDLIPNEDVVVTISHRGYVKRVPLQEYRTQRRGGKGVVGTETKEEDFVEDVIVTKTHNCMLFFTDRGRVHWLKAYNIPEAGRYASGKPIVNMLELKNEKVTAWISMDEFSEREFLVMITRNGIVKRIGADAFANPRKGGVIALTLKEGDSLIDVKKTGGNSDVFIATKEGYAIRFSENDARELGRTGQGVIGIRLREKDEVIGAATCEKPTMLTITENGYGKRTEFSEYRVQARGGLGVTNMNCTEKTGKVVAVKAVDDSGEVIVVSSKGQTIRSPVKDIRVIGRNTQGVRIIRLGDGEKVASFAAVQGENGTS